MQKSTVYLLLVIFMCYKVGSGSIWMYNLHYKLHKRRKSRKGGHLSYDHGRNKYHHICADIYI